MVVTRRVRETHSVTVDGLLAPQGAELIAESVDQVLCGWCGSGESVIELGQTGAI